MARQKNKICLSCNTSFRSKRDAKTCSARCRKRLQRAGGIVARLEQEVEREAHQIEAVVEDSLEHIAVRVVPTYATQSGFVGDNTSVQPPPAAPITGNGSDTITPPGFQASPWEATPTPRTEATLQSEPQAATVTPPTVIQQMVNNAVPEPKVGFKPFAGLKNPHIGRARLVTAVAVLLVIFAGLSFLLLQKSHTQPLASIPTSGNGSSLAIGGQSLHLNLDTTVEAGKHFRATGPVTFQNQTNSTNAFSVQTASSADVLVVDTTNSKIGINTAPTATGADLQVAGDIQTNGALLASGGATSLSNSGLTINKTLVCTAAGCRTGATVTLASTLTGEVNLFNLPVEVTIQGNTFNGASQLVQLTGAGILPTLSGINLTNLNGSNVASGTVADARLSANVTLQSNTFNGASQLVQLDGSGFLPALNGSALTSLNGTNISSGTVADARLSANVALLSGTGLQTFSGNNKFTGTVLLQNAANSATTFQIQNAAGTSNLLVADTVSTRIGIGTATPAYTLDVNGDINSSTGIRVNGALLCNAGGCTASGGSNSYIQNSTALQTANFNIQSASTTSVTGTIRATTSQTADLLQLKDQAGVNLLTIGATGNTLIKPSTNSTTAFQLLNANGTSHLIVGDTLNAKVAIAEVSPTYTLDVGGDINSTTGLRVAGNLVCSTTCTPGGGSGNYIQNGTALQTGNFSIQSAANTSIAASIRGASGQSADLLDLVSGDLGTNVASFGATGNTTFKNSTDSTTAFQIQKADATPLFVVNTTSGQLAVGPSGVPANGVLTIGTNTTAATGGIYFGTDTNLYRSAADRLQTDSAFVVQDAGGITVSGVTAGNAAFRNFLVPGDSNEAIRIDGGGIIRWGAGGASAVDTNLYRSAAGTLKTDSGLIVAGGNFDVTGGNVRLFNGGVNPQIQLVRDSSGNPRIDFGAGGASAVDVNLYRYASNILKTDSEFRAVGNIVATANGTTTQIGSVGPSSQAGLLLGSDTNLYRSAANVLRTDDQLIVAPTPGNFTALTVMNAIGSGTPEGLWVAAGQNSTNAIIGAAQTTGIPSASNGFWRLQGDKKMVFGDGAGTWDTDLYRSAAGTLQTDGSVYVGGAFRVEGEIRLDSTSRAADAQRFFLYTAGETNNTFAIGSDGVMRWYPVNGAADTDLYRGGTGLLLTDGKFQASGNVIVGSGSVSGYGGGSIAFNNIGSGQLPGVVSGGGTLFVNSGTLQYRGAGNIASISSDFSEEMPVENNVQPEDVVSLSDNATADANVSLTGYVLQKSQTSYDSKIMGVVSALAGSQHSPGTQSITFTGRVPVKVTGEGGAIAAGDNLTSSSTPGYAMKMTHAGQSIGKALSDFDGNTSSDQGSVIVSANTSYYNPDTNLQGDDGNFDTFAANNATITSLTVTGNATFQGNIAVQGDLKLSGDRSGTNVPITAGSDQMAVSFSKPEADTSYRVQITPSWRALTWVTDKTAQGFIIHYDPPTTDSQLDWQVIR